MLFKCYVKGLTDDKLLFSYWDKLKKHYPTSYPVKDKMKNYYFTITFSDLFDIRYVMEILKCEYIMINNYNHLVLCKGVSNE